MLKTTTILFLISGSVLAVTHVIALELFLYWRFLWFDIPMHFLGGVVMALLVFTFRDLRLLKKDFWTQCASVVAFVLFAALVWEVYEILIGIPIEENYAADTLLDLIMGVSGGALGAFVGIKMSKLE